MNNLSSAALWYASIGWPIFPCKPGQKEPATKHGVKDATTDSAQISQWWATNPDYNIGFACGGDSKLYAVDVDISEKVSGYKSLEEFPGLIQTVAQWTPRGGMHLIYKTDNPPANKNSFRPGIDIRGDGYYILLAPSLHPNGKNYFWFPGCEPWKIEPREYPNYFRSIPKPDFETPSALPAQPQGDLGRLADRIKRWIVTLDPAIQGENGHSKLLWAAGCLTHGWELTDTEAYSVLVSEYNPRCEPPWDMSNGKDQKDFSRKITESRKNPPRKPRGWLRNDPEYVEIPQAGPVLTASIEKICVGIIDPVAAPVVHSKSDFFRTRPPQMELNFLTAPMGKLGELCSWMNTNSIRKQPFLTLGCSLAFLGALFGRKIKSHRGMRTNIYCMGVADSSAGKAHAQKCIRKLCEFAQISKIIGGDDIASDSAILTRLSRQANTVYLLDEIGHLLSDIKNGNNVYAKKIVPLLIKLYSHAEDKYTAKDLADSESDRELIQPCCCIWGVSEPDRFIAGLSPEELHDGWLSRCLVFRTDTTPEKEEDFTEPRPPLELVEWCRMWFDREIRCPSEDGNLLEWQRIRGWQVDTVGPHQLVVPSTSEAMAIFRKLDKFSGDIGIENHDLSRLWMKAEENSRRVALIYAAGIDFDNPVIDAAIADYSCRLIVYLLRDFGYATVGRIAGSIIEVKKNRLERYIEIMKHKGRTKGQITKGSPWLRMNERAEFLQDLVEAGRLIARTSGGVIYYWTAEFAPEGINE